MSNCHLAAVQSGDAPVAAPSQPEPLLPDTGRRRLVLVNTGALTSASLYRIGMSFVLQLLIARRLGVEGLGHYTIAMAYLNVSQVVSELGLPALLVRDLAQMPSRRRSYFPRLAGHPGGDGAADLGRTGAALAAAALWRHHAHAPCGWWARRCRCLPSPPPSQTLFQAGERMELVMGVEVFINTLILATSAWLCCGGRRRRGSLIAVIIVTQAVSALICLYLVMRSRCWAGIAGSRQHPSLPALLRQALPFFGLSLGDVLLQRIDILLLSIVAGPAVTGIYSARLQCGARLDEAGAELLEGALPDAEPACITRRRRSTSGWRALGCAMACCCSAAGSATIGTAVAWRGARPDLWRRLWRSARTYSRFCCGRRRSFC